MFFGVFTGTFSSIYIASPVLLAIERRWPGPRCPRAPGPAGQRPRRRRAGSRSRSGAADLAGGLATERTTSRAGPSADARRHPLPPRRPGLRPRPRRGARPRLGGGRGPRRRDRRVSGGLRPRARAWPTAEPRLSATAGIHPHDAQDLDPRAGGLAPRAAPASRGSWPPARWASTTTTIIRPATRSAPPSRRSSRSRREAGKPAVIHAREADDDVAAVLREPAGRRPPFSIPSAAGPASCERGSSSATMCRSAGW